MRHALAATVAAASLSLAAFTPAARAEEAPPATPKARRASVPVADQKAAVDRVGAERVRRRDAETRLEQWRKSPPPEAAAPTRRAMDAARGTRAAANRRSP
jgi:hypothetical protein